jgi:hypothetical protein
MGLNPHNERLWELREDVVSSPSSALEDRFFARALALVGLGKPIEGM